MARIGYARVSTKDQNLDLQLAELEKAGCEKVYSEHKSGIKARLKLAEAIKYLRKGDILVVYKFDRLGRSLSDLLNIISELHEKGVEIMSLKDNIDTSSTSGKLMMHIFASLAEFERDLIKEPKPEEKQRWREARKWEDRSLSATKGLELLLCYMPKAWE